jgi:hypothetical protein
MLLLPDATLSHLVEECRKLTSLFTVSFVLPFSDPAFFPDFVALVWSFLDIVANCDFVILFQKLSSKN